MKNIYKSISAAGTALLLTSFLHAQTVTAPVPVVKQEQDQWCWDANSKCILDYYGIANITQCGIAEYARTLQPGTFGSKNCCPLSSGVCNKPNEIDYNYGIKGMIDHFGKISSSAVKSALATTKVVSELTDKRPFVIGVMWNGGGGHVVVGCGYNQTTKAITFMDPWQNNGMTTKNWSGSSSFSTNSGSGNWAESLVLLTPITTGVDNIAGSDNTVTVFPTPAAANTDINIYSDFAIKSVTVFNNLGQSINNYSSVNGKSFTVQLPVAGFYSVQVITDQGIANKKVMVQ